MSAFRKKKVLWTDSSNRGSVVIYVEEMGSRLKQRLTCLSYTYPLDTLPGASTLSGQVSLRARVSTRTLKQLLKKWKESKQVPLPERGKGSLKDMVSYRRPWHRYMYTTEESDLHLSM